MAAPQTMFRRLLIIIAMALPVYFAVWTLIKMDSLPKGRQRPNPFRHFKMVGPLDRSPDFQFLDEHDSDSSIPSLEVFMKAMREKLNADSGLSADGFVPETTQNKNRTANDHSFNTSKYSRKTDSVFSSAQTKSPMKTLRENYRQFCKYLNTSKGLHRICIDRYINGSRGRSTAKAVKTHKEYFTPKTVLQSAVDDVVRPPAMDVQTESSEDEEGIKKPRPLNIKKAPVNDPPKSEPSKHGILHSILWVSYIDPHDYKYQVNPSITTCMDHERVDLLVLVTSHPEHTERRDVIRETWGAPRTTSPVVKVRFLLGVTTQGDQVIDSDLQKEVDEHDDIIVEDFLESYLNLTIKTVMGLKWASRYCPDARYVMKTDDDIIVNMPRLLSYLDTAPRRALITGLLAKNYPVLRDRWEKFYVPTYVYSKTTYPDYCVGLGYIMSIDMVHKLYLQSLLTPLFPWEDVYVGFLLKDIGTIPQNINNFYYSGKSVFEGKTIVEPKTLNRLLSYYTLEGLTPKQTKILWSQWQTDN